MKETLGIGMMMPAALMCVISSGAATQAEELVVVATGGTFYESLNVNFFDPFTEETGIEIIFVEATTNEMNGKMRAMLAGDNVEYDLLTTTDDSVISDADLYQDLDCSKIPNVEKNGVPGACGEKSLMRTLGAHVIAYSEGAFPNGGPTSWAEFWDVEQYPGPRCIIGGTTENHIPLLAALVADGVTSEDLLPIDFDRAVAKLNELKPNIAAYWTSYSQSQQLMRDGECVVSIMTSGRAMALNSEGVPTKIIWNGAFPNTAGWGIARNAPNTEAAYRFLDFWMARPEAHLAFYKTGFYGTALEGVTSLLSPEERKDYFASPENLSGQIQLDFKWIGENHPEIQRRYAEFLIDG